MADQFTELEYKYRADEVGLEDFVALMEEQGYDRSIDVSSWDTYYVHKQRANEFLRYRAGASQELTIKRKTTSKNNWNRVEVDLPLSLEKIDPRTVSRFCNLLGYEENFKIYKTCFIYVNEPYTYVYYVVYDKGMSEAGRFIEVELDKNIIPAYQILKQDINEVINVGENTLRKLGITSRNR